MFHYGVFMEWSNANCERTTILFFARAFNFSVNVITGKMFDAANREWPRVNTVLSRIFAEDRAILYILVFLSGKPRTNLCVPFEALNKNIAG